MDGGRELDELVAKHVLGQRPPKDHVFSPPHDACITCRQWAPAFSTRIEDAFDLVRLMEKRHGFVGKNGFMLTKKVDEGENWYCEFPAPGWGSAEGKTIPEAISKAALDAVGELHESSSAL